MHVNVTEVYGSARPSSPGPTRFGGQTSVYQSLSPVSDWLVQCRFCQNRSAEASISGLTYSQHSHVGSAPITHSFGWQTGGIWADLAVCPRRSWLSSLWVGIPRPLAGECHRLMVSRTSASSRVNYESSASTDLVLSRYRRFPRC